MTPLQQAAQAANSRIASLYEELRKAIDEGSESMTHADALKQIACWQNKEQAQAVEATTTKTEQVAGAISKHISTPLIQREVIAAAQYIAHRYMRPAPPADDFDAWQKNPYTLVLQKSIVEDYVPKEAQQVAVPEWTATADKMPAPCMNVLAYNGKKQPIRAMRVPAKTLEASGDGDFGEYDEATDEMWWPEGWYETNAYEETHWLVDEPVTHWMPLPLPPQGDKP